jgi:acyl-CoA dehydrogenase
VRDLPSLAKEKGVISAEEAQALATRDALRDRVIHVDDFPFTIRASDDAARDAQTPSRNTAPGQGVNPATLFAEVDNAATSRKVA